MPGTVPHHAAGKDHFDPDDSQAILAGITTLRMSLFRTGRFETASPSPVREVKIVELAKKRKDKAHHDNLGAASGFGPPESLTLLAAN